MNKAYKICICCGQGYPATVKYFNRCSFIHDGLQYWCKKCPKRQRANNMLKRAIKAGKIKRPKVCAKCLRRSGAIEGHHPDYTEPLKVEWLCLKCHRAKHHKKQVTQYSPYRSYNAGKP